MANQSDEPEFWLTTAEVAKLFKVHRRTVVRWRKAGKGPACWETPGGHARYARADVEALINVVPFRPAGSAK